MNKTTIESSSRIPKSAYKHTVTKLVQLRRNSKLTGSLKNEIESVKLMPTIEEETVNEVNEFNNKIDTSMSAASNDDSSFTKYRVRSSPTTKLSSDSQTNQSENASKKSSHISMIKPPQSRLFNPTKVSLAKSRSKETAEQADKLERSSTAKDRSTSKTLIKTLSSSVNRQPASKKKDDTISLSKDGPNSSKCKNSNLEREHDQISNQVKDTKDASEFGKSTDTSCIKPKNQLQCEDQTKSKERSVVRSTSLESRRTTEENRLASEQHICRICLDSIQVDGSDLAEVSNCSAASLDSPDAASNEFASDKLDGHSESRNYISPCNCKGQSKFVHRKCLSEWIYVSKKTNCQVCLSRFRNIKIQVYKKSIMKWLTDEYDHLLMLILYLIPFLIDCILIFNFISYDCKLNSMPKTTLVNPSKVVGSNVADFKDEQIDRQLDQLEQSNYDLGDQQVTDEFSSTDQINQAETTIADTNSASSEQSTGRKVDQNFFSSFISFKRTRNLTRTMSLNMFIYNLYFLEMKFYLKNFSICLSGIPVTLLISFPSLILFIRYCKSRYEEWQTENLEVYIDD